MKIKIAILEQDKNYLNKILGFFACKYSGKIEASGFSDYKIALKQIETNMPDIFLFPEDYIDKIDVTKIKSVPVVFVEGNDITEVQGFEVVSKFQKISQIYKKILAVYSANTNYSFVSDASNTTCKTILFTGIAGGVGTTTAALGCAIYLVKHGKRVMYLDLNTLSCVTTFLDGEGNYTMSDILYAIKSKKTNIGMKIESAVCKDISGVEYIKETGTMLDMAEMSNEEAITIWDEVRRLENYDYIIVDVPFKLSGYPADLMTKAQRVVWVSDGSTISNAKMMKAYQATKIFEEQNKKFRATNLSVFYNSVNSKTGQVLESIDMKNLGGAPRIQNATERQVMEHIGGLDIFRTVMEEN